MPLIKASNVKMIINGREVQPWTKICDGDLVGHRVEKCQTCGDTGPCIREECATGAAQWDQNRPPATGDWWLLVPEQLPLQITERCDGFFSLKSGCGRKLSVPFLGFENGLMVRCDPAGDTEFGVRRGQWRLKANTGMFVRVVAAGEPDLRRGTCHVEALSVGRPRMLFACDFVAQWIPVCARGDCKAPRSVHGQGHFAYNHPFLEEDGLALSCGYSPKIDGPASHAYSRPQSLPAGNLLTATGHGLREIAATLGVSVPAGATDEEVRTAARAASEARILAGMLPCDFAWCGKSWDEMARHGQRPADRHYFATADRLFCSSEHFDRWQASRCSSEQFARWNASRLLNGDWSLPEPTYTASVSRIEVHGDPLIGYTLSAWNRLMVIDKDDPALSERTAELAEMGQACVDWFTDTGECHFCEPVVDPPGQQRHGDDCPVGAFLTRHRPDGETPEQLRSAIVATFERGFSRTTPAASEQRVPPPAPPVKAEPYIPAIDDFDLLPDAKPGER